MSNRDPPSKARYSLTRTWYGDQWNIDSEGYLHTGSGSSHVESITITYQGTE